MFRAPRRSCTEWFSFSINEKKYGKKYPNSRLSCLGKYPPLSHFRLLSLTYTLSLSLSLSLHHTHLHTLSRSCYFCVHASSSGALVYVAKIYLFFVRLILERQKPNNWGLFHEKREMERVRVCVIEHQREREREREWEIDRNTKRLYVCECVCERERDTHTERLCAVEREREIILRFFLFLVVAKEKQKESSISMRKELMQKLMTIDLKDFS